MAVTFRNKNDCIRKYFSESFSIGEQSQKLFTSLANKIQNDIL